MKNIYLILPFLLFACSNQPKVVETPPPDQISPNTTASMEAKQLAAEEQAHAVTEISFKRGSSKLTIESQNKLKDLMKRAGKNQKIDEVRLITWGDEEYPDEHVENLSQGQQILVRQRNARIKNYLKTLKKDIDIELISMAERPGKLAELWGESDARMKKSLESAGISNTAEPEKGKSKSSISIVMLVLEPDHKDGAK